MSTTRHPLVIPFLLSPDSSSSSSLPALPVNPTHLVSWSQNTSSGPSHHLALASSDNTLWVVNLLSPPSSSRTIRHDDLLSPPSSSRTIYDDTPSQKRHRNRPSPQRHVSFGRPRAPSSASSILTTGSKRHTAFSPPSSATQLPTTCVSTTTATALSPTSSTPIAEEDHAHLDLLDQLREQRRSEDVDRHGLGLGLGLGLMSRRLSIQGKEEDGNTSPTSVVSNDETIVGRIRAWTGTDDKSKVDEISDDRLSEAAVDLEMQKERIEGERERDGMKVVEEAQKSPLLRQTSHLDQSIDEKKRPVRRIVLSQPGRGKIIALKVFEELGLLCVLRDEGLLDLISLQDLKEKVTVDLEEPEPSKTSETHGRGKTLRLSPFWHWCDVHLVRSENQSVIIAHGIPWPCALPSPNGEVTRVVILRFGHDVQVEARLELPGQGTIGICQNDQTNYLIHATATSLTSYPIIFPKISGPSSLSPSSLSGHPNQNLQDPDMTQQQNRPSQLRAVSSANVSPNIQPLHALEGNEPAPRRNRSLVSLREGEQQKERRFARFLAVKKMDWPIKSGVKEQKEEQRSVELGEGCEVERDGYGHWKKLILHVNGEGLGISDDVAHVCFSVSSPHFTFLSDLYCTLSVPCDKTLAQSYLTTHPTLSSPIVSLAPSFALDFKSLQSGKGNVQKHPFSSLLTDTLPIANDSLSMDRLDSPITSSVLVSAVGKSYMIAGDEDGVVRIWTADPFKLEASFTMFAYPVKTILRLMMPEAGNLRDCVLCTSDVGSVGVISLKEMDQLFLIPASRSPLRKVFIGGTMGQDMLLAYANGKARVWNVETMEFRRSTGLDAAEDMLQSGQWAEVGDSNMDANTGALRSVLNSHVGPILGRLLELDLRRLGEQLRSSGDSPLPELRWLLSLFLTFGLEKGIDDICHENLGILPPGKSAIFGRHDDTQIQLSYTTGPASWCISPYDTGMRQLAIVSLLRPFLDSPDHEKAAADVIAYYTTCLPADIEDAPLDFFAGYYMDSASNVQQAARLLFAARLSRMTDTDLETLILQYQPGLPSLQPNGKQTSAQAALALTMIGGMAIQKYQSMTPSALKAVADSVVLYLDDPHCIHLELAVELCSKGFQTWQTYVDAMDLLRRLFHLATHKENPSSSNTSIIGNSHIAAHARLAVLHVASSNPGLFMSTLSMDILDARSAEGRKSIMKLCVFMARKQPAILENGLPRIAEAVVKSLDPNTGKMREDVWQAATVILNELVQAFSTIDFHSTTQRLAVGTHEGAVIMYDLKTASRLYILEPHKSPVSAITFSPDGRRLVTVSLEQGDLTVWKVGSSLSGFFNVGGPPRQGGEKGEPFKRIVFIRAGDEPMSSTSGLSDVQISWPGNRQARVTIRETALTFET
ncbi:hypothetical protein TREMEDRAFT_27484 [Tremella mesenterica DSM 1558]|uniref:uncharacterized protein n=1 Tax=Tremella mesenterica (strain ATCC 24925 / CBS 8224 / DSM 1558 / NBRC 9311 / NRRL Y-6157 / RJB 2259-6 / UBC 559-6) TaxID=578456 RepID=UPI0003F49EF2|nr:uncharacterized protein TREMEDRAFT_27484 [Tremella mesenterica DSM 1558]EIW71713.1 hypothetical protein TREMEDRAFT_27484 [Tremella mesenterica DSM 1558]